MKVKHHAKKKHQRLDILQFGFLLAFGLIVTRLGYWQLYKHTQLASAAMDQYETSWRVDSKRGLIKDISQKILVGNQEEYTLFAQPPVLHQAPTEIADKLVPILINLDEPENDRQATDEAWLEERETWWHDYVVSKLSSEDKQWLALAHGLNRDQKKEIQSFDIWGLGFDTHFARMYPDASVSAQLLGFVGKTQQGEDLGYFGLEGFYDLELRGREGVVRQQQTALGLPLLFGQNDQLNQEQGSDLTLTVSKSLQYQIENKLKVALETYGAKSGEVVVMNPRTGAVIAMASFPNYDPASFMKFPPSYYRNPVISDLYEPGSTFKVLTVAAGIEEGVINPSTQCPDCDGPRIISGFPIRTWNEVYNPNINMQDALAKSDNTAMVFVQEQLGKDRFLKWLRNFGMNQETGVDLQGEASVPWRDDADWRTIDVATASFGQGFATTSLHMVQAVSAIANGGKLMQPYIVEQVERENETITTRPKVIREVISPQTAQTVTEMMVYTAQQGDAKWALPEGIKIAGKTGTSQIAGEGGYLEDKTIASFIGFAPADDPQFVMLVKLREPTSSPWGSETAAPLWFDILPLLLTNRAVGSL